MANTHDLNILIQYAGDLGGYLRIDDKGKLHISETQPEDFNLCKQYSIDIIHNFIVIVHCFIIEKSHLNTYRSF